MMRLRSGLFYLGQWLSLGLFVPFALLSFPVPLAARVRFIGIWARFQLFWLRLTCGLGYRVRIDGELPERPFIVLSKHQSAWETLAFQVIFSLPVVFVLKQELLRIPLFGWGLALTGPIAIDRSAGRKALDQLVEQGGERLSNGLSVVVFPEGTRMAPGEKGKYNFGGALLASRSGYPVVPVAHNAGSFWPRQSMAKKSGVIDVVIGAPIETEGRTSKMINRDAEAWIESQMVELESRQR